MQYIHDLGVCHFYLKLEKQDIERTAKDEKRILHNPTIQNVYLRFDLKVILKLTTLNSK